MKPYYLSHELNQEDAHTSGVRVLFLFCGVGKRDAGGDKPRPYSPAGINPPPEQRRGRCPHRPADPAAD